MFSCLEVNRRHCEAVRFDYRNVGLKVFRGQTIERLTFETSSKLSQHGWRSRRASTAETLSFATLRPVLHVGYEQTQQTAEALSWAFE